MSYVPDLADLFDSPPGVRRVFIGAAVNDLAKDRLIRKTGEIRATTQARRHGILLTVWALAVDAEGVEAWRGSNPIPPEPESDS